MSPRPTLCEPAPAAPASLQDPSSLSLSFLFTVLVTQRGLWALRSLTGGQAQASSLEGGSYPPGPPGKPSRIFLKPPSCQNLSEPPTVFSKGPRPPEHILTGPPGLQAPHLCTFLPQTSPQQTALQETSVPPQALLRRECCPRQPPPAGPKPAEGRDRVRQGLALRRPVSLTQPRVKSLPGHSDLSLRTSQGQAVPSPSRKAEP